MRRKISDENWGTKCVSLCFPQEDVGSLFCCEAPGTFLSICTGVRSGQESVLTELHWMESVELLVITLQQRGLEVLHTDAILLLQTNALWVQLHQLQ